MNGTINCVVIRPPGYGDNRAGFLQDVAVMTGGRLISKELGLDMEEFMKTFDDKFLGKCDKVVVNEKAALFVKGKGTKAALKGQLEMLREQLKTVPNKALKEVYEERIAKLTCGVAVVRVGAKTEAEGREKLERVKDAVGASQAALTEGYVAGSGVTFLRLAETIKGTTEGVKLLKEVLEQPLRKVLDNCGEPRNRITSLVEALRREKVTVGYDVASGEVTDMVKAGIIDPAKVIRLCIENAIGVATSALTTEVLIDHEPLNTGTGG
jgi:chaperonin GroEL